MTEYTLGIGEEAVIRKRILGSTYKVIYAGMPSNTAYSLVVSYFFGNQAMSYNLYIPLNKREIKLKVGYIIVDHVTPNNIRIRIAENQ